MLYEIQCGAHRVKIEAQTIGQAWRKAVGNIQHGFAPLARFREFHPMPHSPGKTRGKWQYVTPSALETMD